MPEKLSPEVIMADLLCTCLFYGYNENRRRFLYCWERDGLRWLRGLKRRKPINDWTAAFIELNGAAIDEDAPIDWNLRRARLAKEAGSDA